MAVGHWARTSTVCGPQEWSQVANFNIIIKILIKISIMLNLNISFLMIIGSKTLVSKTLLDPIKDTKTQTRSSVTHHK